MLAKQDEEIARLRQELANSKLSTYSFDGSPTWRGVNAAPAANHIPLLVMAATGSPSFLLRPMSPQWLAFLVIRKLYIAEDVAGGFQAAINMSWRGEAKFIFWVGDAPCHGEEFHPSSGLDESK